MKKLLVLLFAASLFVACNNQRPQDNRDKTNTDNRNDNRDNRNDNGNNRTDRTDNNSGWTQSQKDDWMKQCNVSELRDKLGSQKAEDYCQCVLGKIQQRYNTYAEADKNGTEEEGKELGQKCLQEMGLNQ